MNLTKNIYVLNKFGGFDPDGVIKDLTGRYDGAHLIFKVWEDGVCGYNGKREDMLEKLLKNAKGKIDLWPMIVYDNNTTPAQQARQFLARVEAYTGHSAWGGICVKYRPGKAVSAQGVIDFYKAVKSELKTPVIAMVPDLPANCPELPISTALPFADYIMSVINIPFGTSNPWSACRASYIAYGQPKNFIPLISLVSDAMYGYTYKRANVLDFYKSLMMNTGINACAISDYEHIVADGSNLRTVAEAMRWTKEITTEVVVTPTPEPVEETPTEAERVTALVAYAVEKGWIE